MTIEGFTREPWGCAQYLICFTQLPEASLQVVEVLLPLQDEPAKAAGRAQQSPSPEHAVGALTGDLLHGMVVRLVGIEHFLHNVLHFALWHKK